MARFFRQAATRNHRSRHDRSGRQRETGGLSCRNAPVAAPSISFPSHGASNAGSRDIPWTEMNPTGTVVFLHGLAFAGHEPPGWEPELPVVLGLVDIDDGARMYAQITDVAPEDIHVGMRVQAYFERAGDEVCIPKFRPA